MSHRKRLVEQVKNVFRDNVYPGDEQLVFSFPFRDEEREAILRDFKGKHWQELTFETLYEDRNCLSRLTPAAYCFYLPALLIAVLENYETCDTLASSLRYTLTPPESDSHWLEQFYAIVEGLTKPQKMSIRDFFRLDAKLNRVHYFALYMPEIPNPWAKVIEFWDQF
jgi:hypothetical protein